MKFSYKLLKKLVPQIKSKNELSGKLSSRAFEIDSIDSDTIDIKISANRYDASGHIGLAREISALYGKKFKVKEKFRKSKTSKQNFEVVIKDKNLCPRYCAQYFELGKIKETPLFIKNVLADCGMRPISTVVDIMNYVMLETGQPMHAFDLDKLAKINKGKAQIIVRKAKKGEKIETLDGQKFDLDNGELVIADAKHILAIAGIKGGKLAEVDKNTKRIIVESANFDSANIYGTSRKLKLITDASARFSRGISPELAMVAINRAAGLLKEIAGAKEGSAIDVYPKKQPKKILKFDIGRFNSFIGVNFDFKTIKKYLDLLDFGVKVRASQISSVREFIVEVPLLRTDIENPEDLFEEVIRLYGYNELKSVAPRIRIAPSGFEDEIVLKDKIKKVLTGLGLDEVYNHSFVEIEFSFKNDKFKVVELQNPISAEFQHLRPTLAVNLIKDIETNGRFFSKISLFETGKVFFKKAGSDSINELDSLGIIFASKTEERFFELKGLADELFRRIGLTDYFLGEAMGSDWTKDFTSGYLKHGEVLKIESEGKDIGYLGKVKNPSDLEKWHICVMELDLGSLLKLVEGENEFRPLPKYPSVMRDISMLVNKTFKVGDMIQSIQEVDLKHIKDVDLVDEYDDKKLGDKKSLTFRIVFQAEDRTLTDNEVNNEVKKVEEILRKKFNAGIR